MPNWIDVAPAGETSAEGHACVSVEIDGKALPLIVFNVNGSPHVMANVCPHAGLPLGDGERRGLTITCPYHGYTYRITDGQDLDDPEFGEPAKTYPTRIENGRVQIQIESD